jgi:hypothetical protein
VSQRCYIFVLSIAFNLKTFNMKRSILRLSIAAFLSIMTLWFMAERNYQAAKVEAILSEGSDMAIVDAMNNHGFNISDPFADITLFDKIKALFN